MHPFDRPASIRSGRWWGTALGLLGPFAVAVALVPVRDRVTDVDPALVLVLVVLAAGALGGRVAGLLGAASATVAFDVFLTRPYGSLRIDETRDITTTALLATVGLAGALLMERVRRHAARAARLAASLERLERFVELMGGSETAHRQIDLACQELTALLDLKACRYEPGPCAPDDVRLGHGAVRVPGRPTRPGRVVLPVRHRGIDVGHFVLVFPRPSRGVDLAPSARRAAVAVADAVGARRSFDTDVPRGTAPE